MKSTTTTFLLTALALAGCGSDSRGPQGTDPTTSQAPSLEGRILACASDEQSVPPSVDRCVTSDVDIDALGETLLRWGKAQPFFSDVLLDTASFKERYPLGDGEKECLRRAFCNPMKFED